MSFKRIAGIAGIAAVALDVVFLALGGDEPAGDASGAAVLSWLGDNQGLTEFRLAVGAAGFFVAGIFMVGLFGLLRDRERATEDHWSLVGLTGGVISLAALAVGRAAIVALVGRADEVSEGLARFSWDLAGGAASWEVMASALMLTGFSAAIYRTRTLPRWVAHLGFVAAVLVVIPGLASVPTAQLTGVGILLFIAFPVFLLWTLIVSIWMVRTKTADRSHAILSGTAAS